MYCIKCGVKLADTEAKCPLCGTDPLHPDIQRSSVPPLYPKERHPGVRPKSGAINGSILFLFFLPLLITFLVDWQTDHRLSWFGFVAGALVLLYVSLALPRWFRKPNPVIFVPCSLVAVLGYLLYIDLATDGGWFLPFALPITAGIGLILCTVVVLLRYLRRGRLYIFGGAFMALGAWMPLTEFLLTITFHRAFVGWSVYPFAALFLLGGLLIYLAINRSAREMMERKLFL